MDELQLIQGLQTGDEHAIKELLKQYTTKLLYYSKSFVDNREDAQDITSESIIALLQGLKKGTIIINNTANLDSILFTIVKNKSLNSNIARTRYLARVKEYSATFTEEKVIELLESQSYIYDKLYKAIEELPDAEKQVLKMRYIEGLSPTKIAEIKGLSYSTIRNQLSDALKKLRLSFSDEEWKVILLLITSGSLILH